MPLKPTTRTQCMNKPGTGLHSPLLALHLPPATTAPRFHRLRCWVLTQNYCLRRLCRRRWFSSYLLLLWPSVRVDCPYGIPFPSKRWTEVPQRCEEHLPFPLAPHLSLEPAVSTIQHRRVLINQPVCAEAGDWNVVSSCADVVTWVLPS